MPKPFKLCICMLICCFVFKTDASVHIKIRNSEDHMREPQKRENRKLLPQKVHLQKFLPEQILIGKDLPQNIHRQIALQKYPFLNHYVLSDNMKSLLNSKYRRKRLSKRSAGSQVDLGVLEKVIHELATNLKKEFPTKSPAARIRKNVQRKETHSKSSSPTKQKRSRENEKKINKKEVFDIIKTIVSENDHQSQLSNILDSQNKDLAEIKKNLASITEIKRSLDQLNIDGSTNVEKRLLDVVPNPLETYITMQSSTTEQTFLLNGTLPTSFSAFTTTISSSTKTDLTRNGKIKNENEKALTEKKMLEDHNIIERIYADVEYIKKSRALNSGGNGAGGIFKIDFPCNLGGSWISHMGGKVLQITMAPNNVLEVNTTDTVPLREGFLMNPTWKLGGSTPFSGTGLILLTGVNEKCRQVAAFIGECKFCGGREVVQGQWLVGKLAKDCEDIIASQDVIGDVWKKSNLQELRKTKLNIP